MRHSLIAFGLLVAVLAPRGAYATASDSTFRANYKIDFESRLAYHTFAPEDLASLRQVLNAQENLRFSRSFTAVAGARAYADGAFATNDGRYNAPVRKNESLDIIPEDIFVQYRQGPFRLRVGNQNIVWGEAFGAYYADIVNPKDMREYALGDVGNWRLPVPAISTTAFFGDSSFQAIYIPKPFFNKMPSIGNDFAIPYQAFFPNSQISISDDRTLPLQFANGEVGARVTTLVSGFDLALFAFYYHDRFPTYTVRATGGSAIELDAIHPQLASYGFTGSKALDQFVLRWELLYTQNRLFDAIQNGSYVNQISDEGTGVVGLDYNGFSGVRLGLQASKIYRSQEIVGALYGRNRNLISMHVNAALFKNSVADLILNYVPDDGSTLSELRFTIPTSPQFEFTLGADIFLGTPQSQFGLFRSGSRAFVQLHGFFAG